jgi:hypothetical protein
MNLFYCHHHYEYPQRILSGDTREKCLRRDNLTVVVFVSFCGRFCSSFVFNWKETTMYIDSSLDTCNPRKKNEIMHGLDPSRMMEWERPLINSFALFQKGGGCGGSRLLLLFSRHFLTQLNGIDAGVSAEFGSLKKLDTENCFFFVTNSEKQASSPSNEKR